MNQTITLAVDYHDRNCVIMRHDGGTATASATVRVATTPAALRKVLEDARRDAGPGGSVTWVQESTTGWARAAGLMGDGVRFVLANVLQMPPPPGARRRKTDKTDTARLLREQLTGTLPVAYQPAAFRRALRRLVSWRENLVRRRTALRNWVNRYLAHETWHERKGLWSARGQRRLRDWLAALPPSDALVIENMLEELSRLEEQIGAARAALTAAYRESSEARRLDAIAGVGVIAAVSIVARIGEIGRFAKPEQLIAYAGLAPGVRQSDRTRRSGRIGGGGTDRRLRHYLIEATIWARDLPRYAPTYQKVEKRRGAKVGRLVVARLLLRSIHKMLRDDVAFCPDTCVR